MILAKCNKQQVLSNILNDSQLIELQNYLIQYNRNNCPNEFYQSWKILILGANVYKSNQDVILNCAWERYKEIKEV